MDNRESRFHLIEKRAITVNFFVALSDCRRRCREVSGRQMAEISYDEGEEKEERETNPSYSPPASYMTPSSSCKARLSKIVISSLSSLKTRELDERNQVNSSEIRTSRGRSSPSCSSRVAWEILLDPVYLRARCRRRTRSRPRVGSMKRATRLVDDPRAGDENDGKESVFPRTWSRKTRSWKACWPFEDTG